MEPREVSLKEQIEKEIGSNPVIVYSKAWCPFCWMAKRTLKKAQIEYKEVDLKSLPNGPEV